jgi:histidinol-phosphate aminotransferase
VIYLKYRIRKTLEDFTVVSYLKDEGESVHADIIDCSLGVNPCGFSPTITKEIYTQTYDVMSGYPAHPYMAARRNLCQYFAAVADLVPEQIFMQTGSMGALCTLNHIFLEDRTRILTVQPCFSSYTTDARGNGAAIDFVPLQEKEHFQFDADRFMGALHPSQRLVYIDNPNNPTGQAVDLEALKAVLSRARDMDMIVIVDEAYGDFLELSESAVSLVNDWDNLIVVKTFSKGFGLAGLRAGYIVAPKALIPILEKMPGEMNMTSVADAMVMYALRDPDFIERSKVRIAANKEKLINSLQSIKVSVTRETVPIALYYTDKDVDLGSLFWKHGVRVENGVDFEVIGRRHVRVRVPYDVEPLLQRMRQIEDELKG